MPSIYEKNFREPNIFLNRESRFVIRSIYKWRWGRWWW
jgi:hypothetical protein|tara:strand:+ start:452 stop:565 length:114 start_codon:yes stop_codon:yes gene_type:complete